MWEFVCARRVLPGCVILVECSGGTKTRKRKHLGPMEVTVGVPGCAEGGLLVMLADYAEECVLLKCPIVHHIFRPMTPNHRWLEEKGMTSGAMNKMMKALLSWMGGYNGETLHGVRRGSLQNEYYREGRSLEDIAHRHQFSGTEVLYNRYMNMNAHSGRMEGRPPSADWLQPLHGWTARQVAGGPDDQVRVDGVAGVGVAQLAGEDTGAYLEDVHRG